jgi:hypothetical protein
MAMVALVSLCAIGAADAQSLARPKPPGGKAVTAAQVFDEMLQRMREAQAKDPWNPNSRQSNRYQLLDVQAEDWTATPQAKFAHGIKIPNPVPADSGYRPGMSQQEYFEYLCKTEAGEFIFKSVDNIAGIFQLRPRKNIYSDAELQHLYAMEDPYGHYTEENENIGFQMVEPLKYSFFEIPVAGVPKYGADWRDLLDPSHFASPSTGTTVARYSGLGVSSPNKRSMKLEFDTQAKARYGYTWRGIKRPHDREMGIGGGELIVLDLQTNEVMAVRRGYAIWNRGWTYRVCPRYGYDGGEDKGTDFTAIFVMKVVRPPRWKEYFQRLEKMRVLPPGVKPFDAR